MKEKFNVSGMTCSSCSANIEKSVGKLDGVTEVNVNLLQNTMVVEYDEGKVGTDTIIKTVDAAGYKAGVFGADKEEKNSSQGLADDEIREMKVRLIVSFAFLIPLLYIAMGHMWHLPMPNWLHGNENAITFAFTQLIFSLPIAYVNRKYFTVGYKALFRGSPNMDSLIAVGSSAAFIYGIFAIYKIGYGLGHGIPEMVEEYTMDLYFESAATILSLITLGKFLEVASKGKTSEAISKLIDLSPKTASVLRDGVESEIPVGEVLVGDIIVIRPGQSIPVDGVIIEGSSSVDQAALTGESIPVEKTVGDNVSAATINKQGFFKFRATKVGDDTALAQIIKLVEEAASSKAPIAKLADKISGVFVPVVIIIAVVSTIIWLMSGAGFEFSLSIGIAVLVISCPCALGLATPVAIMVGTGRGATHGILIKSAQALETAHSINTVVLDKTGTITEGKPRVTDTMAAEGVTEEELVRYAASIEKPSEHPLAEAIIKKAEEMGITLYETADFTAVSGRGIIASIEGKKYIAGNLALMRENKIDSSAFDGLAETYAHDGKTALYFADGTKILGMIAAADVIKPESRRAIKSFKKMGMDVVMLTGDNRTTAEAIGRNLDVDRVVAEVLPGDKEAEIRRIQESGKKVAMVGDGINDAPALVRADVGIAIGAGTDVAIESADIVLMRSNLKDAATAIDLSRATIKNIKQNLFWAFFYNTLGIPLAAGVFFPMMEWKLNPMFAAAAMSLSSVFVVFNALRLRFFKPRENNL